MKHINKKYDRIRPLKFWGKPTIRLVMMGHGVLSKGNTPTNTIKDALFNLKRGVSMAEYQCRRNWLKEMLLASEENDDWYNIAFFDNYED